MSLVVLDQGRLKVVLVSPRNPLNIGAAARAMSNFGFFDLRLVNSYDVAYREARSAVNASAVMESAREFATVAEAVADCSLVVGTTALGHRELQHPLRRLEYGGRLIRKHAASENVALMFGSEKFGLSNDDMAFCHWLVRIPTREGHQSMNLGQAVAICLYELIRNPRAAAREPMRIKPAQGEQLERLSQMLHTTLEESGYMNPTTQVSSEAKLRRLVRRMKPSVRDADVWLGMIRQILWKVRH